MCQQYNKYINFYRNCHIYHLSIIQKIEWAWSIKPNPYELGLRPYKWAITALRCPKFAKKNTQNTCSRHAKKYKTVKIDRFNQ